MITHLRAIRVGDLPRLCGMATLAGAVAVLAAWAFDWRVVIQPVPGIAGMKVNTALTLAACGLALWLLSAGHLRQLSLCLAGLVALIGVLSMFEDLARTELGIDELFIADLTAAPGLAPGRMSVLTAACFSVMGTALAFSHSRRHAWIAQGLTLGALLVTTAAAMGYLYDVRELYSGRHTSTTMAAHTTLLVVVAAIGIFFLEPRSALAGVLSADSLDGRIARGILPIVIGVPILVGFFQSMGQRAGWLDAQFGPALAVLTTVTILSVLIWRRARRLAATEASVFFRFFEFAPDGIFAIEPDGRITRTNAKAQQLFGYTADELAGGSIEALIPRWSSHNPLPQPANYLELAGSQSTRAGRDLQAVKKDGTEFPVDVVLSPMDAPDAALVLCVVRDVTERHRSEEALRTKEDRLRSGQRLEALGQLAGGIAHDLNNMVAVVSGYSDKLERLLTDPEAHSSLRAIKLSADKCAGLTSRLLAFSRRQVLTPTSLSLNEIVSDVSEMLPMLLGDHVEVSVLTEPRLWSTRADALQLEQVVVNLMMNARDAMPEGGRITIETANVLLYERPASQGPAAPRPFAMLSVSDTGCGMDEETVKRIFDPYFTTKPAGQGTGLGLSTAYGFITQSGGYIDVESAPRLGTTFRVYLPRHRAGADAQSPSMAAGPATQPCLLLVEDDALLRGLLAGELRQAGFDLIVAADANEAAQRATQHAVRPTALVTDVSLPGRDGGELASSLLQTWPDLRMVFMSGHARNAVVTRLMSTHHARFLQKPFAPGVLVETVCELVGVDTGPTMLHERQGAGNQRDAGEVNSTCQTTSY